MTADLGLCRYREPDGVECGLPASVLYRGMCEHEHSLSGLLCVLHGLVMSYELTVNGNIAACGECRKIDGHECLVTPELVRL